MSSFGQNQIQTNVSNNLPQQRFVQVNQVFASNMVGNSNKPVRASANPQVQVQRASGASSNQRQQRRRVVNTANTNVSNVIQPLVNFSENNINDDIQVQGNFSQQDNNVGNAPDSYRDGNMIEQIASVNIPAIQVGTGSLNLNLDLPTIKLPAIKFASCKSVSSSTHKSHTIKMKLAKLNRNFGGKLSLKKKLKIKVDNCFKW